MTYNFDPDHWFDMQSALLKRKLEEGSMSKAEYDSAIKELEQRVEEMWERLDGTYRVNDLEDKKE